MEKYISWVSCKDSYQKMSQQKKNPITPSLKVRHVQFSFLIYHPKLCSICQFEDGLKVESSLLASDLRQCIKPKVLALGNL